MTRSTRACRPIRRCSVYLTSGGRLLLTPPVTIARGGGSDGAGADRWRARVVRDGAGDRGARTVVLALQQIVATPVHYVYESLTSPTNVAGILRLFDEGTWPARLFGTIDVFGLWWMWLLSVGLAAATGQTGAPIFVAAAGRLCGRGSDRRRGVRGAGRGI